MGGAGTQSSAGDVRDSALRSSLSSRDRGGRTRTPAAPGAFSRGDAESQIGHAPHLSPALRGLK